MSIENLGNRERTITDILNLAIPKDRIIEVLSKNLIMEAPEYIEHCIAAGFSQNEYTNMRVGYLERQNKLVHKLANEIIEGE